MTQRQFKRKRHELRELISIARTPEESERLKAELAALRAEYEGKAAPNSHVLAAPGTAPLFGDGTVPPNPENAASWRYDDPELNALLARSYALLQTEKGN